MNSCKSVSLGLFTGPEVGSLRKNTICCKKFRPCKSRGCLVSSRRAGVQPEPRALPMGSSAGPELPPLRREGTRFEPGSATERAANSSG